MGVGRGVDVWWLWSDAGSPAQLAGCGGQAHVGMDMDEHPLRSPPKGGVAVAGEVQGLLDLVGGMRGGAFHPRTVTVGPGALVRATPGRLACPAASGGWLPAKPSCPPPQAGLAPQTVGLCESPSWGQLDVFL